MERDVHAHLFIEVGRYKGDLYGTSIKAVQEVATQVCVCERVSVRKQRWWYSKVKYGPTKVCKLQLITVTARDSPRACSLLVLVIEYGAFELITAMAELSSRERSPNRMCGKQTFEGACQNAFIVF